MAKHRKDRSKGVAPDWTKWLAPLSPIAGAVVAALIRIRTGG